MPCRAICALLADNPTQPDRPDGRRPRLARSRRPPGGAHLLRPRRGDRAARRPDQDVDRLRSGPARAAAGRRSDSSTRRSRWAWRRAMSPAIAAWSTTCSAIRAAPSAIIELALRHGADPEVTRRLALSLAISGERERALQLLEEQLLRPRSGRGAHPRLGAGADRRHRRRQPRRPGGDARRRRRRRWRRSSPGCRA